MQELEEEKSIIFSWAENHPLVKRAYLFGSRLKGSHRDDSDLDVAVELNRAYANESLLSTWIHESREMQSELQALIKHKVDLQWYESREETPEMYKYLNEASVAIYP